ncbi:MAG TPA: monofunctional biosynthetic peptidoglycan transglycosylase, partial [bacterium]|nr:monofunctional biosynthetic peptidoglycan transglycosylase [bacterium]
MSVRQRLVWIATLAGKAAGLFVLGSMLLVLVLRWVPLPGSSYMVQTAISAWWAGQGATLRYEWTPYARIAPAAALAVIA